MNSSQISQLDKNSIIRFSLALQTNVQQFYNKTFTQIVASPELEGVLNGSIPHHDSSYLQALFLDAFGDTINVADLPGIVKKLDHPDNRPSACIVIYVLTAVTTFIVALRMYSRHKYCGGIRGNDWMLLAALALQYINEAVELTAAYKFGAGTHTYDVTYYQYKWNLVLCYVCQLLYFPNLLLVKMSLLLFYMELSPHWLFRRVVLGTAAMFILIAVAFEFAVAFQCKPFDYWNYPAGNFHCINQLALFQSMGVINIISDFLVFLMPVAVVVRLKLRLREKIIVISLFGLGAFACITSVFRLFSLVEFARSLDVNYTEAEIAIWSLFEVHLGIICASIPSLKSLLMHYAPRVLGYGSAKGSTYSSRSRSTKPSDSALKTIGSTGFEMQRSRAGAGIMYTTDGEDVEMGISEYRNSKMREDLLSPGTPAGERENEKRISTISKASKSDDGRGGLAVQSTISLGSSSGSLRELVVEDGEEDSRSNNRHSARTDNSDFSIQMIPSPSDAPPHMQ